MATGKYAGRVEVEPVPRDNADRAHFSADRAHFSADRAHFSAECARDLHGRCPLGGGGVPSRLGWGAQSAGVGCPLGKLVTSNANYQYLVLPSSGIQFY